MEDEILRNSRFYLGSRIRREEREGLETNLRFWSINMAAEIRDNKCVVLKNRPGVESQPNDSNFALEKREVQPCNEGEILVKTLYLSVDPYMRCRMNEETGSSYLTPWPLGDPPTGGGVGQVIQSKSKNFKEGDIVESFLWPWQELVVFSGDNPRLVKVKCADCSLKSEWDISIFLSA